MHLHIEAEGAEQTTIRPALPRQYNDSDGLAIPSFFISR